MRRVTRFLLAATGLTAAGLFGSAAPGALATPGAPPATGTLAAPAPAGSGDAAASAPTPGKPVCTIKDPNYRGENYRLMELSGLAATANGYVTVNDSTEILVRQRVFFLDQGCNVSREVRYSGSPYDPEDLALGKDGTVWVADIGDNDGSRASIALWKVPPNGNTASLFRMKYPDGKHNAEALLLDANDRPIIVTKGAGAASIYTPSAPLAANTTVPLQKAGEFKPQQTGTSNPLGRLGQTPVTGGASSPDRRKVVLRTYSDAYEWDVPDGDVVKAITTGEPRITPLPDEPFGEAITYSGDGATFLTVSEMAGHLDAPPQILQYTPATGAEPAPTGAAGTAPKRNTLSWYERLSLAEATSLIAGVGVIGVLLVVAGVVGILRARRGAAGNRGRGEGDGAESDVPTAPNGGGGVYYAGAAGHGAQTEDPDERWRDPAGYAGTEYGGSQYGAGQYATGSYGADQHGGAQYGGGQYGGDQYGGNQYGGDQYSGGQYDGGHGEPHEYGPPAGYPPPAGR